MPLNLSTKSYSSPSILNAANRSFLNYPFASLLSRAAAHQLPLYETSPLHSSASSPIKDYAYNRRQRERTTFDPHEETPRLLQIFTDTKHPTRYQIASICENLNALPCRKGSLDSFADPQLLFARLQGRKRSNRTISNIGSRTLERL